MTGRPICTAAQGDLFARADAPSVSGADISPCGRYRYRLWRTWDASVRPAVFVMLNPSTADGRDDDPTIRRCIGFARGWGAGGIVVVNLYAWRATDPKELAAARTAGCDIQGPERDVHLRAAFAQTEGIVAAWGAHALARDAVRGVLALVPDSARVECLGVTREGFPRHPLYLAAATPRELFKVCHER